MFPKLTNIDPIISASIKSKDSIEASKLNCFVRIISGAGTGLIMTSNPDWKLFAAAGLTEPTFYGDSVGSGTIGVNWATQAVYASTSNNIGDIPFKPSPIVTAINVKEGKDQISRHCDLKITAYTLAQVEVLQTYLMEPGYTLFIEYGWNTDLGVSGLISTNARTIVDDAGKYSLDQDSLHLKRIGTHGDYDSFLGFIVGGTVTSNGDLFDINIKLRGAPGLPTYLQSHNNIEVIADGKVSNKYSIPPFGVTELNLEAADQMAERRFKQMFNDLPKVRQTTFVRDLISNGEYFTNLDFINFDPVIEVQISNFRDGRDASGVQLPADTQIVPTNANVSGKEIEDAGGFNPKKLEEIAEKIVQVQISIEKNATPPAVVVGGFFTLDTPWENYLQSKSEAGDPITAEEINEAIKKYLTVGKIERNPWPYPSYSATTYTKKPIQPAPAATAAVTASADKTGGGNTAAIANVAAGVNATEIELAGGLMLPKEKLFSKNKYVRFGKVVDILNANSSIQAYVVAGRQINTKLDIKDTPIGSFPGIYSCKPEALVIPGKIPDFSKFFMEQNLSNLNDGEPLVDLSIGDKSFTQTTELASNGFSEKPNYWGYLENLYINFELLKKELDDTNKTIREVLQSLLNEMSSAVDGFWNFQIVEKSLAAKEKSGVDKQTVVYTVIDENWIGKNPNPAPVKFVHSGEQSRFLDANLNIDIPGSTTSQIISKRLALSANPSQPNLELGGVFTEKADRFMRNYVSIPGSPDKGKAGTSGTSGVSGTSGTSGNATERKLTNTLDNISTDTLTDEQKKQKQALIDREIANAEIIKKLDASRTTLIAKRNERASASIDRNLTEAERTKKMNALDVEIKDLETAITADDVLVKKEETDIKTAVEEFDKAALDQIATNISTNLEKIDVVPNPQQNSITQDDLKDFMNTPALFKEKFRIYCCRDTKYLNILKVNAMSVSSGGGGRLSHPLPIKYSFTILGKSGIRRGDTFNIIGIPEKYANHGLFQVTQIEHTIQSMKWTTLVQGEYRQQQ